MIGELWARIYQAFVKVGVWGVNILLGGIFWYYLSKGIMLLLVRVITD